MSKGNHYQSVTSCSYPQKIQGETRLQGSVRETDQGLFSKLLQSGFCMEKGHAIHN